MKRRNRCLLIRKNVTDTIWWARLHSSRATQQLLSHAPCCGLLFPRIPLGRCALPGSSRAKSRLHANTEYSSSLTFNTKLLPFLTCRSGFLSLSLSPSLSISLCLSLCVCACVCVHTLPYNCVILLVFFFSVCLFLAKKKKKSVTVLHFHLSYTSRWCYCLFQGHFVRFYCFDCSVRMK